MGRDKRGRIPPGIEPHSGRDPRVGPEVPWSALSLSFGLVLNLDTLAD